MGFILAFFLLTLFLSSAELLLLLQVATAWGFAPAFLLCVVTGLAGGWVVRRQGLRTLVEIQTSLARGRVPAEEIVSGLVLILLGAFLIVPGFITDVAGLALLLPPLRRGLARQLIRRFRGRVIWRTPMATRGQADAGDPHLYEAHFYAAEAETSATDSDDSADGNPGASGSGVRKSITADTELV